MSLLGIGASLLGGFLGKSAADKAADAQVEAAEISAEVARETRDLTRADMRPFYGAGTTAINALSYMMGLGPAPIVGGQPAEIQTIYGDGIGSLNFDALGNGNRMAGGASKSGRKIQITPETGRAGDRRLNPEWERWNNQDPQDRNGHRPRQYLPANAAGSGARYVVNGKTFSSLEEAQAYAAANGVGAQAFEAPVIAPWDITIDDFEADPGYEFRRGEGMRAVEGGVAARQGLNSGAAMKALERYGQDYATNEYNNFYNRKTGEYNNYVNRLAGMANSGQNAAAGMAGANAQAAQQQINAYGNMGNAQAAGYIGGANAINQGIGNALGAWQYSNLVNNPAPSTGGMPLWV